MLDEFDHRVEIIRLGESILPVPVTNLDQLVSAALAQRQRVLAAFR